MTGDSATAGAAPAPASSRPLRVGIQLPEVEREVRWPEYLAMAQAAEAVGFDTLWLGDHLLYRYPDGSTRAPWEAWTMLAGLAAATSRIRLGPLVASTAFHAPAMLAKLAATVDEISGGRLVLGLGAGWNETEFRAFGIPFDRRVARFDPVQAPFFHPVGQLDAPLQNKGAEIVEAHLQRLLTGHH